MEGIERECHAIKVILFAQMVDRLPKKYKTTVLMSSVSLKMEQPQIQKYLLLNSL